MRPRFRLLVMVLAALALASMPARAEPSPDLHAYWDQRCKGCHDDAAAFARRSLKVVDGRLIGAHHRDTLATFLRQHYLADDYVTPVMAMLTAQATAEPLFRKHCAACHGTAAELARQSLRLGRDGLTGRDGGQRVAELLRTHGGLTGDERESMVRTLSRVHREVGSP